VDSADVLIIGGGIVGENAAYIAKGMGAEVTILDNNVPRLRELDNKFAGRVHCVFSNRASIEKYALEADLVVGAVLVAGAAAPKLLTRDIISRMKTGSVVVDVAIDQGGGVLKPPGQLPIRTLLSWWMMWCITAWQICRAWYQGLPRSG